MFKLFLIVLLVILLGLFVIKSLFAKNINLKSLSYFILSILDMSALSYAISMD